MTVEALQNLSTAFYIVAGVLFLISVALFFLFNVPKLYSDISGKTAKKAIETIRKRNESTGEKAYKPSPVNAARGKVTDEITSSGKIQVKATDSVGSVGTEKFSTAQIAPTNNETTLLQKPSNETTILQSDSGVTTMLDNNQEDTVKDTESVSSKNNSPQSGEFSVEEEISFSESSEIIE